VQFQPDWLQLPSHHKAPFSSLYKGSQHTGRFSAPEKAPATVASDPYLSEMCVHVAAVFEKNKLTFMTAEALIRY